MAERVDDRTQQNKKKRVTVPEIYRKAARILKSAEEKKGSLKNLIYSSGFRDIKPLYALVAESSKHKSELDVLISNTAGLQNVHPYDPHLSRILITELIWGKGYLKPENARAIRIILELENDLRSTLESVKLQPENEPIPQISVPRFVRVNTLVSSIDKVCTRFIAEGWKQVKWKKTSDYEGFIERVKILGSDEFVVDFHLDFLLLFPPGAQFHNHFLLKNGSILLQDKASCLSAVALKPKEGFNGKIIDACSAPGMKTSLLAALSNNQNSIIAIERDVKRCKTLRKTVSNARASKVSVQCADFLKLNPAEHKDVKYILVDPSCSGTGIINHLDPKQKPDEDVLQLRLKKLSSLQSRLVEHAATFPHVERIVYSTCSIHEEENEAVVKQVLAKIGQSFDLKEALPWWTRRGIARHDEPSESSVGVIGLKCVRAEAEKDLTNGFFIALFVRR